MDLYVVRHAIAAAQSEGVDDAERPLTDAGRERFRRCVEGLDALGVRFERLLHSPLLRAVQTAEELAPLADGETVVTPHLASPPSEALLEELEDHPSAAVVGHEPWTGELVSLLLTGEFRRPALDFKKGGVAWLRGEPRPRGMELVAFLPPRVLVRLRR